MYIKGLIHNVNLNNKIIGIKCYKNIKYFIFNNSQMNMFKKYLYVGNIIELYYEETNTKIKRNIFCYNISYISSLYAVGINKVIYYDKSILNKSLSSFLSSLGNLMILDLEMTMPDYGKRGSFTPEVIQAGYILLDSSLNEIERYRKYIIPSLSKKVNKRTLNFLKLQEEDFNFNAIDYNQFYDEFKDVIDEYKPTVVIYGKNDSIVLNSSFNINSKEDLNLRYVNLCQLVKNYYELKNDPGLFKLYQAYYDVENVQVHDALDDSYITSLVFKAFIDDVNHKIDKMRIIREKFE